MSPRLPPKISLRHDWTNELGSKVDRQPEGKLLDNQEEKLFDKPSFSNQPNQFQNQSVIDNEFNREINEEDIDFNIPGLPHSTVKQLHGASVRDLIQKIENQPESARSSTRPTTESIIQSLQPRIKRNDL